MEARTGASQVAFRATSQIAARKRLRGQVIITSPVPRLQLVARDCIYSGAAAVAEADKLNGRV